jgi:WD40 repeat protein
MPRQTKTFRIFVSSTFNDLKAERNALQEKVFPELQKLCEVNGCRFQAVDLRWGVSEEAAFDQQTMNICLTELKRCQVVSPRPNFIILLGDRYGWIPLPPQIEAAEFEAIFSRVADDNKTLLAEWYRLDTNAVPPEYVLRPRREEVFAEADYASWGKTEERLRAILLGAIVRLGWPLDDERRIKYECSATHQEIIEGALKLPDEREHVFAFLRNIRNVEDLPPGSDYTGAGLEKALTLKETIKHTTGVTSYSYDVTWNGQDFESHIGRFTADTSTSLRRIIEEEIHKLEKIDELTRENEAHEEFGAERCRHFVGRQKILDDIAAYIHGDQQSPLVVYGPSGSGKSALMAKAFLDAADKHKQEYIIRRFIGATPGSTDIRTLLRNLCLEISHAFGFDQLKEQELANATDPKARDVVMRKYEIPEEYRYLSGRFREFLGMIPVDRRLLLFLDALDQLSATDSAHSLNWLPSTLPANVKVVVTVLEREDDAGQCLRSARTKLPESALLRLEDMTVEEGDQVLRKWLIEAYPEKKRTLTDEQMKNVLDRFRGCPKPLYLKLAFEEARRWKSYDELPCGADNVPGLAGDVPGVVGDMLARLRDKKQHGVVLVKTFLGLLSAARHGLSESEIIELLSADKAVMVDLKARSARSPEAKGIPAVVWLRLYHDFSPYLIERSADNTVLLAFYHRQVGETVKRDYVHPKWHTHLARYFRKKADPPGDSTWSGNYVHGLAELPFQQTESGSMWDEIESTLADLHFIEAKCKAGMVYDLSADYGRAERAWPGQEEERQKEAERQRRLRAYTDKLIDHARNPKANPLPDPPRLVEIRNSESVTEMRHEWTPLERVHAWGHFVGTHIRRLADEVEPVFQMAWNNAASGPVAEQVAKMECEGKGLSREWLRLRNRPPFTPNPACLKVLEGHTNSVCAVAMTPDGGRAISGSDDKTLRLWDLATGACLKVLEGHTDDVNAVSITPDGERAISGGRDKTLRVWDLAAGECLKVLEGHTSYVQAVAITPDGGRAVSGSSDDTLRLWDLATGECLKVLKGHTDIVSAVSITPDGRRAVSGSRGINQRSDNTLRLWDLTTGECLKVLEGHTNWVFAVSITPDGVQAVSGGSDNTLRLWDLATGECLKVLEGHTGGVLTVSITPHGGRVVSGGWDNTLRLWDLATGACLKVLEGHTEDVRAVSITPDGGCAVSGGEDKTLRLWDLAAGAYLKVLEGHTGGVLTVSITPYGGRVVSGNWDNTLRLWDLATGACLKVLEGHTEDVRAVSITPDGGCAVSGGEDNTIRLWDLATGTCVKVLEGHKGWVWAVAITPDGRRAISGSYDGTLRLWDLATGECLKVLGGLTPWFFAVTITPDGRRAVWGHEDRTLRLWDLATGECLKVLKGHTNEVFHVTITPDGGRAVSTSEDCTLRLWNLATGKCLKVMKGHTGMVFAVTITPDGKRAVSGSDDKTLRVWDLATGKCLMVLEGHTEYVGPIFITPDGKWAVSGSKDNTIRLWDLATGKCGVLCEMGGSIQSLAVHSAVLVAGEYKGRVDVFTMGNYCQGRAVITAARLRLFDRSQWDARLTALCPWCGGRFDADPFFDPSSPGFGRQSPGTRKTYVLLSPEINCPMPGCGKPLKLNPFVCDNSG